MIAVSKAMLDTIIFLIWLWIGAFVLYEYSGISLVHKYGGYKYLIAIILMLFYSLQNHKHIK